MAVDFKTPENSSPVAMLLIVSTVSLNPHTLGQRPNFLLIPNSQAWYPVAVVILIHTQRSPVIESLHAQLDIVAQEEHVTPSVEDSSVILTSNL